MANTEVFSPQDREPSDKERALWLIAKIRETNPGEAVPAKEVERLTGLTWQSPRLMRNIIGSDFYFYTLLEDEPRRTTRTTDTCLLVLDGTDWEKHDEKRRRRARKSMKRALRSTVALQEQMRAEGRLDDDTRRRLEAKAAADSMVLEVQRRVRRKKWLETTDGKRHLENIRGEAAPE